MDPLSLEPKETKRGRKKKEQEPRPPKEPKQKKEKQTKTKDGGIIAVSTVRPIIINFETD